MDILGDDLLKLINALLSGFVASWVFYGLTPHPKTTEFERVVQALIFSAFVQVLVALVRWIASWWWFGWNIGYWDANVELAWSVALALAFGFVVAVCANQGQPHKLLHKRIPIGKRGIRLTKRTAYPSEWANAFNADRENDNCFVTLHLKNGRRIFGHVCEFPDQPTSGHFRLHHARWFTDECETLHLECAEALIAGADVEFAEFDAKDLDSLNPSCDSGNEPATKNAQVEASALTELPTSLEPKESSVHSGRCSDQL